VALGMLVWTAVFGILPVAGAATSLEAARAEATVWTLDSLLARALYHNPSLLAARSLVDQAQGRLIDAGRLENPTVNLSYGSDQAFNNEGENRMSLGFTQKFPITQRLKLQRTIARDAVDLVQVEILDHERLLRRDVELAVYALAETVAERQLLDRLIVFNRECLKFIESRIKLGEASEVDANRLQLEIYSLEQAYQQLENVALEQTAALRQLCGLSETAALELDFELILPAAEPDLVVLTQSKLEQHPAYQMGHGLLQLAEVNLSLVRAERWGDIEVEIFYEAERGVDAPTGLGRDRFFGLGLSLPLPLNNRNRGQIAERQAQRAQLHFELKAIEAQLRSEADTQCQIVRRTYQQAVHYQTEVTPTVEANLRVMNEAYAAGQINLTDLFRTQEQSLRIQSTQLQLLRQLAESQSRWRAATGLKNQN
ncbi:MAG: cobalt-zinc-cadmium efflux system outer membrane protein, partial [Lentimonas sp.]